MNLYCIQYQSNTENANMVYSDKFVSFSPIPIIRVPARGNLF